MRAYVNYDSLVVSAAPGEINAVTVRPDPERRFDTGPVYLITDPGASITPGAGCVRSGFGKVVRCTLDREYPVASLSLYLGDRGDVADVDGYFYLFQAYGGSGDDRLKLVGGQASTGYSRPSTYIHLDGGNDKLDLSESFEGTTDVFGDAGDDEINAHGFIYGGDGADTLTGSSQKDYLYGEGGDDTLDTRDTYSSDVADCGAGTDVGVVDTIDHMEGCEKVTRCPTPFDDPPDDGLHLDCTLNEAKKRLP